MQNKWFLKLVHDSTVLADQIQKPDVIPEKDSWKTICRSFVRSTNQLSTSLNTLKQIQWSLDGCRYLLGNYKDKELNDICSWNVFSGDEIYERDTNLLAIVVQPTTLPWFTVKKLVKVTRNHNSSWNSVKNTKNSNFNHQTFKLLYFMCSSVITDLISSWNYYLWNFLVTLIKFTWLYTSHKNQQLKKLFQLKDR